jgi:hypothetical protein
MKINLVMSLSDLAELMGPSATQDDAIAMRDLMIAGDYAGLDTSDLTQMEWERLLEEVGWINGMEV